LKSNKYCYITNSVIEKTKQIKSGPNITWQN